MIFASFLLFAGGCKKDVPEVKPEEKPLDWSLRDSGVYDTGSYFPLRVGAYWVYEHTNGDTDTSRCTKRSAQGHDTGYVYTAKLRKSSYEVYSFRDEGAYIGYKRFPSAPCYGDPRVFWPTLKHLEYIYPISCTYFPNPGQSPQQKVWSEPMSICLSPDTSVDGYDHVKAYIKTYNNVSVQGETTPETVWPDYNVRRVTSIFFDPYKSVYEENYYAKGIGRIKTLYYENAQLVDTERLIDYRIQ